LLIKYELDENLMLSSFRMKVIPETNNTQQHTPVFFFYKEKNIVD